MATVVEKPDGTVVIAVRLTLKPGRDDALIALIRLAPRRGLAATIREAMRGGVGVTNEMTTTESELDLSALGLEL
jgi:hypothetical protein